MIVMDHQPGNIRDYGEETDLILCGHTHKGQMFPFNLITDAVLMWIMDIYRASVDSPQVIVTSGAGTWGPPQRVATDNEVAEILGDASCKTVRAAAEGIKNTNKDTFFGEPRSCFQTVFLYYDR